MARTVSGVLALSKTEVRNLLKLIEHVKRDIRYSAGGTFALNPGMDDEVDVAEIDRVTQAIETLKFIIEVGKPNK